jgi:hypothetical protein
MIKKGEIKGLSINNHPTVYFKEMEEDNILGYYDNKDNSINLNFKKYSNDMFLRYLYDSNNGEDFDLSKLVNSPELFDYFSTSEPVCTFIHEITHAILNHSHDKNFACSHSNVTIIIYGEHDLGFYEAALKLYINTSLKYDLFDLYHEELFSV